MRVGWRRFRPDDLFHQRHHGGRDDEADGDAEEGVREGERPGLVPRQKPQRFERHRAAFRDIASGKEAARVPTSRRVASGVAVSSDDRYAFVTQEGVGSEPGAVDVIDLRSLTKVATIDIGQQAGGIDFWKTTAPR